MTLPAFEGDPAAVTAGHTGPSWHDEQPEPAEGFHTGPQLA